MVILDHACRERGVLTGDGEIANDFIGVRCIQDVINDVDSGVFAADDRGRFFRLELAIKCAGLLQW